MFEKKELILGDDLRQKTRKFDGKNGQYPSINLIFDEKCGYKNHQHSVKWKMTKIAHFLSFLR